MNTSVTTRYNLDNLEASFREFLISQNVSSITLKNYLSDFRHFFGWLFLTLRSENKDLLLEQQLDFVSMLSQIRVDTISRYKEYLTLNKLPIATINRRLSTLRKFCTHCINQGWMKENLAKKVGNNSVNKVKPTEALIKVDETSPDEETALKGFKLSLTYLQLSQNQRLLIQENIEEFFTIINS